MFKRSILITVAVILLVIFGCATGVRKPGTGGKSTAKKIETGHQDVPEGVKCYVCHKSELPTEEFHKAYGVNCETCHGKVTWMAYKYPHEKWELGIHRKMQCNRCHTSMSTFDFSVWQCWGCHHDETQTAENHKERGFNDIKNCIQCHKGSKSI